MFDIIHPDDPVKRLPRNNLLLLEEWVEVPEIPRKPITAQRKMSQTDSCSKPTPTPCRFVDNVAKQELESGTTESREESNDSESDEEYTVMYSQSEEDRTGPDREEVAEIEVSQQEAVEQLPVATDEAQRPEVHT